MAHIGLTPQSIHQLGGSGAKERKTGRRPSSGKTPGSWKRPAPLPSSWNVSPRVSPNPSHPLFPSPPSVLERAAIATARSWSSTTCWVCSTGSFPGTSSGMPVSGSRSNTAVKTYIDEVKQGVFPMTPNRSYEPRRPFRRPQGRGNPSPSPPGSLWAGGPDGQTTPGNAFVPDCYVFPEAPSMRAMPALRRPAMSRPGWPDGPFPPARSPLTGGSPGLLDCRRAGDL
jgi:hypothetical protein